MRRGGFTLIELSIALAIAAVMFAAAVIAAGAISGSKAKAAAGELGGVIRSLYDTAALSGKTCRLVFELPGPKDDEGITRYWAECASGNLTVTQDRDEELKELKGAKERESQGGDRFRSYGGAGDSKLQDLLAMEKQRVEGAARYAEYTSPEIAPRELPSAVSIGVWTQHQRETVKSGSAYLYFFPQGFTERAQLYVRQGSNVWTLKVAPLTGKTSVVAEELEVPRS